MKTTHVLLAVFSYIFINFSQDSYAQSCPLPNGSFEVWEEQTGTFDPDGSWPDSTVISPEGYSPLIRLIFSDFIDLFFESAPEDQLELADQVLGYSRVEDATDGQYALKIGGDAITPFADVVGSFLCEEGIPSNFSLDVKHGGTCSDTLNLFISFGDSTNLPTDETELQNAAGYVLVDNVVMEGDTEYESLFFPIINNNNGMPFDTMLFFMVVSGDQTCLESNEGFFIIDNMRLIPSVTVSLFDSKLEAKQVENEIHLSWDMFENGNIKEYIVERSFGNIQTFDEIAKIPINASSTNSTSYIFEDDALLINGEYFYRIRAIDENGVANVTDVVSVDFEWMNGNGIKIYPNPTQQNVSIDLSAEIISDHIDYEIFDLGGKICLKGTFIEQSSNQHSMEIGLETLP